MDPAGVETGMVDQVLHQPAHAYTRELLAAVPELPRAWWQRKRGKKPVLKRWQAYRTRANAPAGSLRYTRLKFSLAFRRNEG